MPALPEVIETLETRYDYGDNIVLNDMASGMISSSFALGVIIGNSSGGFLKDRFGYTNTTYIQMGLSIVFAYSFLFFTVIKPRFSKKKRGYESLKDL